MIVTQIKALGKGRNEIYVDEEFACVLYRGELRRLNIREGEAVSEQTMTEIMQEILPKRAKLRSLNLLTSRSYTEYQLRTKLEEGRYPETVTEEAIAYVKSYGYLDDYRYAVSYAEDHMSARSIRRILQDLQQKGIDRDTAASALAFLQERDGAQNQDEMIQKELEKKHYTASGDPKELRRIYAYLLRKGYTQDAIRRVVGSYTED